MHIKKFRAVTISEALEKVKQELGEDAVIMHTGHRQVKHPSGNGTIRIAEVVAAVDFAMLSGNTGSINRTRPSPVIKKRPENTSEIEKAVTYTRHLDRTPGMKNAGEPVSGPARPDTERENEIAELRKMLQEAINALRDAGRKDRVQPEEPSPLDIITRVFRQLDIPAIMHQPLASRLLEQEYSKNLDERTVLKWTRKYAERNLKTVADRPARGKPCWQAFIGPTGVGKTTTIAKLAALRHYVHNEQGLLISVDSYRLGGFEHLQGYGQLIGIPVKRADNHTELIRLFAENRDKDFIFVDTTGRSPVMKEHLYELGRLFDAVPGLEARAFLCANYKAEDMEQLIKLYRKLPVKGWILSKTDETRQYAPFFLPLLGYQLPVSHITNGQRVPEDIKTADRKILMKMLFPERITKIYTPFKPVTTEEAGKRGTACTKVMEQV